MRSLHKSLRKFTVYWRQIHASTQWFCLWHGIRSDMRTAKRWQLVINKTEPFFFQLQKMSKIPTTCHNQTGTKQKKYFLFKKKNGDWSKTYKILVIFQASKSIRVPEYPFIPSSVNHYHRKIIMYIYVKFLMLALELSTIKLQGGHYHLIKLLMSPNEDVLFTKSQIG